MPLQPKWLEKAKQTYNFHRLQLLSHDKWSVEETAKLLRRSKGSVNEDLMIARWCRTHEKQLERMSYAYEALAFIREKQREMDTAELT